MPATPRRSGAAHAGRPRRRYRARRPAAFYAEALQPADRDDLAEAASMRGLDQEIAVLRVRVRRLLSERPDDVALAVRSIDLLVRAVAASARIASDDSHEALDRVTAELDGIVALIEDATGEEP
jgi:hypothetical protein